MAVRSLVLLLVLLLLLRLAVPVVSFRLVRAWGRSIQPLPAGIVVATAGGWDDGQRRRHVCFARGSRLASYMRNSYLHTLVALGNNVGLGLGSCLEMFLK